MNNSYLKRHEENIQSADYLINKHGFYCSSIHCSYYSIFQLLLHIHKQRDTQLFRDRNKLDKAGSHELMINGTFEIIEVTNPVDAGKFLRTMNILKGNRKDSDYSEDHIDKTRSLYVYKLAQELKELLSKTLL